MAANRRKVIVTGDITLDWILARSRAAPQRGFHWDPQYYMQSYHHFGGASLLGNLIREVVKNTSLRTDVLVPNPQATPIPGSPPFWHSYTIASRFRKVPHDHNTDSEMVWRAYEYLGLDRQPSNDREAPAVNLLKEDRGDADLVVFSDANQGFRRLKNKIWPRSLKSPKKSCWLLLKLSRPNFRQPKDFDYMDAFENRAAVVVAVNDLRLREMQISRSLSWERTADDLIREISNLNILSRCTYFIVSIQGDGALLISNHGDRKRAALFYDPRSIEAESQKSVDGMMVGYTMCLVSGLALHMISSSDPLAGLGPGLLCGLAAARNLLTDGFASLGGKKYDQPTSPFPEKLSFPIGRLSNEIKESYKRLLAMPEQKRLTHFLEHPIACEGPFKPNWTILKDRYPNEDKVFQLATEIIERGRKDQDWDVPVGKFGNLIATDRAEIENLRAIRSLIDEYKNSSSQRSPLSIAVFGRPGSGKSYTIKQVAASLTSNEPVQELTFNLSQFSGPDAILSALHQVRDSVLSGIVPLVFWDEFDTSLQGHEFGWLRYFLAPMQDGKFLSGPLMHNIGRAIFVFAGGITHSMEDFQNAVAKKGETKGTDFISRLKGFVNIPTVDHKEEEALDTGVLIRRALLLRSIIERSASHLIQQSVPTGAGGKAATKINLDPGVLNAFLRVQKYKYAARSVEAIVNMSVLVDRSMFERSCLPTEAQLELHVNAKSFLALVRGHSQDAKAE
jgi:hypothetical protein